MSKTYLAIAALLAMTVQAHAGPVLGGSTLSVSNSATSATTADLEEQSWFSFLLARFELVANITTGKITPSMDEGAYASKECTETDKAADGEGADDKDADQKQSGPEPVYFAF